METTHIEIGKKTRRRLRVWKAKRDETYDEAINALLEMADEAESLVSNQGVDLTGGDHDFSE